MVGLVGATLVGAVTEGAGAPVGGGIGTIAVLFGLNRLWAII